MTDLEDSPYCPVCSSCGEEVCCSPLKCQMLGDCSYSGSYLKDLKMGYSMNEWVQENLLKEDLISKDLIEKYNEQWEKTYEDIFKKETGAK